VVVFVQLLNEEDEMSIPVFCRVCGDCADEVSGMAFFGGEFTTTYYGDCPGKGNHCMRREKKCFFGLLSDVRLAYYHTETESAWYEYVGPASRFLLWLAIMHIGGGGGVVVVNHQWVWWELKMGFFGDGFDELFKKKPA
jgi:hypothetical protein